MRWQPIDESLTLRFTWGLGFREPSLEELYSGPISDIQPSHDPQNGGAFEPETTTLILSSPNLQPEDSETWSGGFVYTPKFVPGLTISTDLWQIERTGVIQSAFLDAVLAREAAGGLLAGEQVERLPDGPSRASSCPIGTKLPKKQTASISVFSTLADGLRHVYLADAGDLSQFL